MERIGNIVGNVHADGDLAALYDGHESADTLQRVVIDANDCRRSRFRATTDAGTDIGVVVNKAAVSVRDVLLVEADRHIVERIVADVIPGLEIHEATVNADLFVTNLDDVDPGGARGVEYVSNHDHGHDHGHGHSHEDDDAHDHTHGSHHGH